MVFPCSLAQSASREALGFFVAAKAAGVGAGVQAQKVFVEACSFLCENLVEKFEMPKR